MQKIYNSIAGALEVRLFCIDQTLYGGRGYLRRKIYNAMC